MKKDDSMKPEIDIRKCNKKMCKTCIFHPGQKVVTDERLTGIKLYLISGTNHICHTTNIICRGARDFQLKAFAAMGIIPEATDEALYKANDKFLKEHESNN